MELPVDEIEEGRAALGNALAFTEGASSLLLVKDIRPFPEKTDSCDVILIPEPNGGYPSRLFFSEKLNGPISRNWNGERQFFERTWFAFSWSGVEVSGRRLITLIQQHLRGLTAA